MNKLQKLTPLHLEEILRLAATGLGYVEIQRKLEAGTETLEGEQLSCVNISRQAITKHVQNRPEEVDAWRYELFGKVKDKVMAWPAYRLDEQDKLYKRCLELAESTDGLERQRYMSLAAKLLADAREEASKMAPREGTKHLHLHEHGGNGDGELAEALSARLAELSDAGMMDDAVSLLGTGKRKRKRKSGAGAGASASASASDPAPALEPTLSVSS